MTAGSTDRERLQVVLKGRCCCGDDGTETTADAILAALDGPIPWKPEETERERVAREMYQRRHVGSLNWFEETNIVHERWAFAADYALRLRDDAVQDALEHCAIHMCHETDQRFIRDFARREREAK